MARHYKEDESDPRSEAGVANVRTTLSEEARDMRNAGRKLVSTEDDSKGDLYGAVVMLQEIVNDEKRENKAIVKRMQSMVQTMQDVLDEVEQVRQEAQDTSHNAQQAALVGVNKAQKDAEEITIKNINEVTERSKSYIDAMVQESKRRIERLAVITLPDRLFHFAKWVVLILVLVILVHVVWQMMAV